MTTLVPLGDGDTLYDLLTRRQNDVFETEPGVLPAKSFGYELHTAPVIPPYFTKRWIGRWAKVYVPGSGLAAMTFDGPMGGGSDGTLRIEDVQIQGWGYDIVLLLKNANSLRIHEVHTHGGLVGIELRNHGRIDNNLDHPDGGFSEKNHLISCEASNTKDAALVFNRGTGNRSFNGTVIRDFSSHGSGYPLLITAGSHVYGSTISGVGWTKNGPKVNGDIEGTDLTWRTERSGDGGTYLLYLNGHRSREAGRIEVHGVWSFATGIAVDLPANKTLAEVTPRDWLVTGDPHPSIPILGA